MKLVYVIVIIILLISSDIRYYFKRKPKIINTNNVNFRTGDIILFKWNGYNMFTYDSIKKKSTTNFHMISHSISNTLQSIVKGHEYTHSAVVVVMNDIPYVYDCTNTNSYVREKYCAYTGNFINETPCLLPLKFLNYYDGHCYHFSYVGPKITFSRVVPFIKKYKNIKLYLSFIKMFYNCIVNSTEPDYFTCCSFVSHFLNRHGIINIPNIYIMTPQMLYNSILQSNNYISNPILLQNLSAIVSQ